MSKDIEFNNLASDQKKIFLKAKMALAEEDLALLDSFDKTLQTPHGRHVVTSIIKICDPFGRDFVNNGNTAFNAGMSEVGFTVHVYAIRSGHELKTSECISKEAADKLLNAKTNIRDEIHDINEQLKRI